MARPVYVVAGLIEILIRPGFDVTRHELSLMSLGNLRWIQIANFLGCRRWRPRLSPTTSQ